MNKSISKASKELTEAFTQNKAIEKAILKRNAYKLTEEGWCYWNFVIREIAHAKM